MSYILDALKKSERERPAGQVPDLFTVHGPQPPSPRRPVRAIAAGALLLGVPAIALLIWIGSGPRDDGAGRAQKTEPSPPAAGTPAQPAPPAPVFAPDRPAPDPVPSAAAPARTADRTRKPTGGRPVMTAPRNDGTVSPLPASPTLPVAPPVPADPVTLVPSPAAAAPPLLVPPAAAPPLLVPPPAAALAAPVAVTEPVVPESPPPAPAVASPVVFPAPVPVIEPAAEPAPPADGRVLELGELPAPVRVQLPRLAVSGHVWSDEPSLRLLSVDDQLLREGGEAAPGVRLEQITPAGAIFSHRGWRFRVPGGRP